MTSALKILIIEDDIDIAELLEYNLSQEKWLPTVVSEGKKGIAKAQELKPDLILLDLMLPDMSGLDICRTIKGSSDTSHIPVIMLTAKGEEIDRIVGFEIGADDYVTKPFSPRELILRIKSVLKRNTKNSQESKNPKSTKPIQFGELSFDKDKYEVFVGSEAIQLTSLEFKLLQYFLENRGRVATRENLLDRVWGYDADLTTRTVDTHIKRLREKLKSVGDYIETIRGLGYRFKENP